MRQVASGGMGTVYLARRREGGFQRLYAVKRLHPHLRDDPDFRAMFVEEARLAGLITHPNVVGVLDVGEDHEGPFLVMDFVQGLPLSQLITLANRSEAPLAVQSCVRIALAVARGLHASHELRDHEGRALQLVHRDLSPQNVLIGWDGTVRITDFGIAKALG
ncbi:MAG: serine/threonine protein kinase, partial [Myxococcales bacterium]|nr:serine/threonine protein kinase [Myxococcales bacterium]